ncbi:glycosyltransferase [Sulfitobacter sabulilitoris]|uniref:Glycosyltransferase n=1 Tax=Sulfitobacter sabulilitoris TaxID=2562655 RepID=A0A5S3P7M9_9RHOB|nr:glycosyltransferase [Sulfitobacter sabulilitoris]
MRRLLGLFDRYCAQNLFMRLPGFPLEVSGAVVGEVTQIARRGNRLEITGAAQAGRVTLHCGEDRVSTVPRRDPARPDAAGRFVLDLPVSDGALQLSLDRTDAHVFALPRFPARAYRVSRWRLVPRFGLGLLRASPLILLWAVKKTPALRPRIREALGFWVLPSARGLAPDIFAGSPAGPPLPEVEVTCVLPVYDAFDLLPDVLDRVCRHTDVPWHLVIIEDASPDPAVRPFLRDWADARNRDRPGCVTLLENAVNLGFIGSVNRGFEQALPRGGPVILLNADAFVPHGWASRLIGPLLADPSVASVTPMSNDAEIFSVPVICARGDLAPGQGDAVDAVARRFAPGAGDAPAPTGVGFCMALGADWLARVPRFDTAFGRGYGEEVDWCRRTQALGGRHLGVANLFVEHRGGASFGSDEKRRLIAANSDTISIRYPAYDIEVQDHLRSDPMTTPRLALAIAWLAAGAGDRPVPIYLAHAMGGGVEHYQRQRLDRDIARLGGGVVLRVGTALRWRLELHCAMGVTMGETDDFALIVSMLTPLTRRRVVYSCAVGDSDPVTIPDRLLDLVDDPGATTAELEILFHDFYPLSPSFNLLGQDGMFHGVPGSQTQDSVHRARRPDGSPVSLRDWRAAWGRLIARADSILTFSADSRTHVLAVWPEAAPRITVTPHELHHAIPRLLPRVGAKPVVGVLGNLNRQKGSALIAEAGRLLNAGTGDLGLVIIGDTDPACPPAQGVKVHGEYRLQDLAILTRRYQISAWLIPSICPETFSYTTHEALATGLPVFCLDLGAQAEAVRAAVGKDGPQGHVIARHASLHDQAQAVLDRLRAVLLAGR